ncbi:F-box/LRR-repeat protein 12-like [Rutidosis leptorrhynchoides]|uniref:F-box/LRR-repeat protein 12-like n=1 Tax=Rutidosis leptorrhynchoides TaxID=125765 RepID=UPI003A998DBB
MDVSDDGKQITQFPDDILNLIYEKLDEECDQRSFCLTGHRFLDSTISSCKCLKDVTKLRKSYNLDSIVLGTYLCRFRHFDSISVLNLHYTPITDNGLETLTRYCNNSVIHVDLRGCDDITNAGICFLKQNCPQLRVLKISNCKKLVGLTSEQGFSETLTYLSADARVLYPTGLLSGGGLEYLIIYDRDNNPKNKDCLLKIGSGMAKNLKILSFLRGSYVDDDIIVNVTKGCPLLQELHLTYCKGIRDRGWLSIGLHCQNLETLHVNKAKYLTTKGLRALTNCSKLSVLYINDCPLIDSYDIHEFEMKRPDVKIIEDDACPSYPSWGLIPM